MVDILLIQPPIRDFYLTVKRTVPYGLACIAASLMKEGFTVDIFDGLATSRSKILDWPSEMSHLEPYYGKSDISPFSLFHQFRHYGYSYEHIARMARDSGAFLVGISSLFTAYRDEAIQMAEMVKKHHPNCRVVLGGHHPTALPYDVMQHPAIDYVLRGEGEISMPVLAKAVQSRIDLTEVPGIVFRQSADSVYCSEPATIADLDAQPLPAENLFKHSFYQRGKSGSAVVVASRGCPMTCSYCAIGSSRYSSFRQRRIESVMDEIDLVITRHEAGFIDFEDENLSLNKEWFLDLLNQISTRYNDSNLELRAMNGLFPPTIDEAVIQAMKTAGFKVLNLSMGTSSLDQLRRFRRPDVKQAVINVLTLTGKHNMAAVVYVIAGAPGQSAEDSVRDLVFLASKKCLVGVSIFYPAPGSRDYHRCAVMGILPERFSLMRSSVVPISDTTSRTESVTLLRLARILNFLKSLSPRELSTLTPAPFVEKELTELRDRKTIGMQLLRCFFYDGIIRGVTGDGDIYEHCTSKNLILLFIEGIKDLIALKGQL